MKYVASNSNGKDSLWMILELVRRKYPLDMVLFFDGGKEFRAIYETWEKVKVILDENNIPWDVIKPDLDFDYCFSKKKVKCRDGSEKSGYSWCGGVCRWMTKLKVRAIQKYYKEHFGDEVIVEYVGYAADELDRVQVPNPKENSVKLYPLITWGYTENDCFVGCYKAGFKWQEPDMDMELYQILDRVSCWCCGNKNLDELRNMYQYLPYYWEKLKEMQSQTDIPMKKYGSVFELEKRFEKEISVKKNNPTKLKSKKQKEEFLQLSLFDKK